MKIEKMGKKPIQVIKLSCDGERNKIESSIEIGFAAETMQTPMIALNSDRKRKLWQAFFKEDSFE